jgi:restriction system protein
MAVWLVRAGSQGQFEQKFLQDSRVYVTWDGLDVNIAALKDRPALFDALTTRNPETKPKAIHNWVSQLWPFAHEIKKGDLVVLPLKSQPAIQIGEVTGDYVFEAKGPNPYFHFRTVKWIGEAIPRANFGQDLLYSFGAFLTICRIQRNNAEVRINAMRASGWKAEAMPAVAKVTTAAGEEQTQALTEDSDLEQLAMDQLARLIASRFKGHNLTRLVDGLLRAQGYTTYVSPPGADGGADILAGTGPLGFGTPRICVEVKSEESPIDRPTVDKLLGAVTKFGATEGLFVSWSGFRTTVQKELASSYFRVRLWTQKELLEALFANYDKLDEDLRAELPLKRVWMVAAPDDE